MVVASSSASRMYAVAQLQEERRDYKHLRMYSFITLPTQYTGCLVRLHSMASLCYETAFYASCIWKQYLTAYWSKTFSLRVMLLSWPWYELPSVIQPQFRCTAFVVTDVPKNKPPPPWKHVTSSSPTNGAGAQRANLRWDASSLPQTKPAVVFLFCFSIYTTLKSIELKDTVLIIIWVVGIKSRFYSILFNIRVWKQKKVVNLMTLQTWCLNLDCWL